MSPFTNNRSIDREELKAVVYALLVCGLFITFLSAVHRPSRRIRTASSNLTIPPPMAPNKLLDISEPPPPADAIERFRVVPEKFKQFDFKNHSYGVYSFPDGGNIDLTLNGSDLSLPNRSGWFSLRDVYYTDVTGDGKSEAIVRLSHVKCGGSCDGGADLFYIYALRNGKLKTIWQYETGSYGYGCGLKSFTVTSESLVLELFGRCRNQGTDDPGTSKFVVKDLTFILFEYNGLRFVSKETTVVPTPPTNVKNYDATIRIQ